MPISNEDYPTNRRASSDKKTTDVTKSDWPIVTQTVYLSVAKTPDPSMDPKLRALCYARNQLGVALLAVDKALKDYGPDRNDHKLDGNAQVKSVWGRIRQVRVYAEKALTSFPLRIENREGR